MPAGNRKQINVYLLCFDSARNRVIKIFFEGFDDASSNLESIKRNNERLRKCN